MKRNEKLFFHTLDEPTAEDEVVIAKAEDIGLIGTVWGRCESKKELGLEVGEEPAVGWRGGVMELVNYDVVKMQR